jgi:hypothetical protein
MPEITWHGIEPGNPGLKSKMKMGLKWCVRYHYTKKPSFLISELPICLYTCQIPNGTRVIGVFSLTEDRRAAKSMARACRGEVRLCYSVDDILIAFLGFQFNQLSSSLLCNISVRIYTLMSGEGEH